jgi:SET domain
MSIGFCLIMIGSNSKLRVKLVGGNGRTGLFALRHIIKREILIDLNNERTLPSPTRTSLQIGNRKHVVGRVKTIAYLNHACEPNAFLDFSTLSVTALRSIQKGEEITINYAATEYKMRNSFRCGCGSPTCLGMIEGFKYLARDQQIRLTPVLAPHLLRRFKKLKRNRQLVKPDWLRCSHKYLFSPRRTRTSKNAMGARPRPEIMRKPTVC